MSFELVIKQDFSAAHQLVGYCGECAKYHGHNFKVEVAVRGDQLDKVGMIIDSKKLKALLSEVLADLDHTCLNELEVFKEIQPTVENIAKYIYDALSKLLAESPVSLSHVKVSETEKMSVSYMPEK